MSLGDTLAEARRFLSLPPPDPVKRNPRPRRASPGSREAAARPWAASNPIAGTLVRTYLADRALRRGGELPALRYHPHCYYRRSEDRKSVGSGKSVAVRGDVGGRRRRKKK